MNLTRRDALLALLATPTLAPAGRRGDAGSTDRVDARTLLQLQETASPFEDAREHLAGRPILDGATLMLLEYSRRAGTFSARQMLRELRDHATAWSSHRLQRGHGGAARGWIRDAQELDTSLASALEHRDFEVRDTAAERWQALVGTREAALRAATRFLLPEARRAIGEFDSERGAFAFRPDLSYSFGDGRHPVGRLFMPLEPSGELYAALELPALRLPLIDPRTGQGGTTGLPVTDRAAVRRIAGGADLRVFYELSLRPGLQRRASADPRRVHRAAPVLSALLADLQAVLVCEPGGAVLAYATLAQPVRL